jgi:hypothetical protein
MPVIHTQFSKDLEVLLSLDSYFRIPLSLSSQLGQIILPAFYYSY